MRDPSKKRVVILVLAAHFLFIVYIHLSFSSPVKKTTKPLIVKTITQAAVSPKEQKAPRTSSRPAASSAPSVKEAPKKEKEKEKEREKESAQPTKKKVEKVPPIADKKLVKGKKEPPPKKPASETREKMSKKLLQELEESLSKLEEKPQKKSGSSKSGGKAQPAPLSLHIESDAQDAGDAGEYDNSLIGYLKQALNLPEHGEVKIQLTLKQDGSFVNLVVIKAESEKNRKYLEASLPHLRFPHLEGKKKQETFIVTFCNEI